MKIGAVLVLVYLIDTPLRAAEAIVFSYIQSNAAPFALMDAKDALSGGILKDVGAGIGKELNKPVKFKLSSRNRISSDIVEGAVDVNCFLKQSWVPDSKLFDWTSNASFSDSNRLYILSESNDISSVDQLKGKKIGTYLGYYYSPEVMDGFKKNIFIRSDITDGKQNYLKLLAKRIDAFIESEIIYLYQAKKKKDLQGKLKAASLKLAGEGEVYCAVSKKSATKVAEIDKALGIMHANGSINKILESYRSPF